MPGLTTPEQLWDDILSRQVERIQAAWSRLDMEAQQALLAHLERMASEEGWHPEQVRNARKALQVIRRIDQAG